MLNYDEFKCYVKEHIKEYMPSEFETATVELVKTLKNNGEERAGLVVRKDGSQIAPNVYLEEFYSKYENGGNLQGVMIRIADTSAMNQGPEDFVKIARQFSNYEDIKDKIIVCAVNMERNREMLKGVPFTQKEDMALIYKIYIGNVDGVNATVTIQDEYLKTWNISKDELHELAVKNSNELLPARVQTIGEALGGTIGAAPGDFEIPGMYIVSNEKGLNGASAIFYSDALKDLAEKENGNLMILPSSVHETIVVADSMGEVEMFADMVKSVNASEVSAEDFLSDHVYRYDAKAETIKLADTTLEELNIEPIRKDEMDITQNRAASRK